MAKIPTKGEPTTEASTTFAGATGLAFKVSKEFRHEFKVSAAENDISMTALLHECYVAWKKRDSDKTNNLESDTEK